MRFWCSFQWPEQWVQWSFVMAQHHLKSFWKQANIKISWAVGALYVITTVCISNQKAVINVLIISWALKDHGSPCKLAFLFLRTWGSELHQFRSVGIMIWILCCFADLLIGFTLLTWYFKAKSIVQLYCYQLRKYWFTSIAGWSVWCNVQIRY